jgi:transglutaminase-like putative cysteine protease
MATSNRPDGVELRVSARLVYRFDCPAEVFLLLEAAHGPDQTVRREALSVLPAVEVSCPDNPETGERCAIFTAAGQVEILYEADVAVAPRDTGLKGLPATPIHSLPAETLRFLRPSRFCPSDLFDALAKQEFGDVEGGDKVEAILAWIGRTISYEAGASDARTTAMDTFVSRAGVCRDFAHLAITLCRAAEIPARAVSAYAWKLEPPDMHAVAEVFLDGRWRLVDPTGKAPVDGLVRVSTGLDAADIAFMTIFGAADLVEQSFTVAEIGEEAGLAAVA